MDSKSVENLLKEKRIYQIINPRLVKAKPSDSLESVISTIQSHNAGYAVIEDQEKVVGIFTEVDVTRKVLNNKVSLSEPVEQYMTKDPICLSPQDSVGKAIDMMGQHKFYHIPLIDDGGKLCGVLSVRSLIRFLAEFYPTEIFNLPPMSDQIMETPEGG